MQSWNMGAQATPHVAAMAGSRFVLASEVAENRKLNESLTKDLTGGDSMSARFLFSNPFTFTPTHKLWIFGNYKPKVSGTDWGFWRCIRVIPFSVTIPESVRKPMGTLLEIFDNEMPGILAWAVTGCLMWQSDGLDMPESVRTATQEYRTEQDLVQQFINEKCEQHPDYSVGKDNLYASWKSWCDDQGEKEALRHSKKWLTHQMTDRGFDPTGQGRSFLKGIRIKA
jgi:putative DNA primase/helicase